MFGPGRGTAGGCFVTPCQGVFLIRRVLWLGFCAWNSGIACQNLEFFIRFRSDVWPGQRDGRRLFRHAVPVCFPDSKGVLWLGFCAWKRGNCLPETLIWSFGSGVTFGRAVECLVAWFSVPGTVELPARTSFGSGMTFGPGRGTAGSYSITPCQGVFLI